MIIELKFKNRLKYWGTIHLEQRSNICDHQPVKTFKGANAMTNNTHNTILKMKRRKLLTNERNKKLLHNTK